MGEVNLSTESSKLVLRIEDDNWTKLSLRTGSGEYVLGGDKLEVIVSRLRDALTKPFEGEFAGNIENVKVQWVLTLAEKHSTIYRGLVGNVLHLYVELPDTSMLDPIRLKRARRNGLTASVRYLELA